MAGGGENTTNKLQQRQELSGISLVHLVVHVVEAN